MPKIKKKMKAQMQSEDEIRSMAHNVSHYYQVYQKQFNAAIAVIVLALAVVLIYSFVRSGNEKKASQLLSAAYDVYSPGGAPSNYPQALQRFQDIVKQYGGTISGAIAQCYIGNTYVQMGQPEAALKEYETFIKKYSNETFLLGLVYQRMGYAYLAMGKQEEAVKAFGQAEAINGTGPATLELARLHDRAGKSQEALKKYKEISDNLPSSAWAMEARKKLPPPALGQAPIAVQPGAAAK